MSNQEQTATAASNASRSEAAERKRVRDAERKRAKRAEERAEREAKSAPRPTPVADAAALADAPQPVPAAPEPEPTPETTDEAVIPNGVDHASPAFDSLPNEAELVAARESEPVPEVEIELEVVSEPTVEAADAAEPVQDVALDATPPAPMPEVVQLPARVDEHTSPLERERQAVLEQILQYFAVDARAAERARIGMLGTRALKNILEHYVTHLGAAGTNRAQALVEHYLGVLNDPATVQARKLLEDSGNSYVKMAQQVARAIGSDIFTNRLTDDDFVRRARDSVRDNAVLKSAILALEPHLARYLGKGETVEYPHEVPASLTTLLGILQHAVPHLNALRDREAGLREALQETKDALDHQRALLREEREAHAVETKRLAAQVVATTDPTTLIYDRRGRLFLSHEWLPDGRATGERRLSLRGFRWTTDPTAALKLPNSEAALRFVDSCLAKRRPGDTREPTLFATPVKQIGLANLAYYLPELEG